MNVRDNEVKKPTQEPPNKPAPAPELSTTQALDNHADTSTDQTATPQQLAVNRPRQHFWSKRFRDIWVPVMNLVIALCALVVIAFQSWINNEQAKTMNEQSQFMREQTQFIRLQTQIMEKTFGLSEKSLRISERAYVSVSSLTAKLADKQVVIELGNNGTLPATAINVEANVYRATPSSGESKIKDVVSRKTLWDAGAVALFPGNIRMPVVISLQDFTQEEMKAVSGKKETLYVGGMVRYKDRNGTDDSTPFAYEYDPVNDTWIANSDLSKLFDKNDQ
jgi:hypothetical protein